MACLSRRGEYHFSLGNVSDVIYDSRSLLLLLLTTMSLKILSVFGKHSNASLVYGGPGVLKSNQILTDEGCISLGKLISLIHSWIASCLCWLPQGTYFLLPPPPFFWCPPSRQVRHHHCIFLSLFHFPFHFLKHVPIDWKGPQQQQRVSFLRRVTRWKNE